MKSIKFNCEVITPMFLAGADGTTPELRPPSIKGMLRFWWRAMQSYDKISDLHQAEANIFGGADEKTGRSKFFIRIPHFEPETVKFPVLPHSNDPWKKKTAFPGIVPGEHFEVIGNMGHDIQALFSLASLFGGVGKRCRRGFGSFQVNGNHKDANLESILDVLNQLSRNFIIANNRIERKSPFPREKYPFIRFIELGKTYKTYNDLLYHISKSTHNCNLEHKFWSVFTGDAIKTRLAAPIYISIIKTGESEYRPIITTLETLFKPDFTITGNPAKGFAAQDFLKGEIL